MSVTGVWKAAMQIWKQKKLQKKMKVRRKLNISGAQARNHKTSLLQWIEAELKTRQDDLEVAQACISEGNLEFLYTLAQKVLASKQMQYVQSLIDEGLRESTVMKVWLKH